MSLTRCSTCGSELGGRSICPRCGTLVGVEMSLARLQSKGRALFDARIASIPQRLRPHHFLWACALMPVVMLPPLFSLMSAFVSMRRSQDGAGQDVSYEWIALISVLNIILSALILYKFHFSPAELASAIGGLIRSGLQTLFNFIPHPASPTSPRLIPA